MIVASKMMMVLHEKLGEIDETLVYTFGRVNVSPNIHTVIPNQVMFTIDSRHQRPEVMQKVEEVLTGLPAEETGCRIQPVKLWGEIPYF